MTHGMTADRLHDYLDDRLDDDARAAVERHVGSCRDCAATLERLRSLLHHAASAPRHIEPPVDLWPMLRVELERRPRGGRVLAGSWSGEWRRRTMLAAAAVALVAASSAITSVVVRRESLPMVIVTPSDGRQREAAALASFRDVEAEYARVAAELTQSVEARRAELAPETVAHVEASLRIIDEAIGEARSALERDPGNEHLVEMLSTTYEQKLDFLKRTTNLAAQS